MRPAKQPTREQLDLSQFLYALSDPVRVDIVLGIMDEGEQVCSHCRVDMPKSSLSHHFKVLREAGVIATRIEGTRHINSVRSTDLNARFPGLLSSVLKAAKHERECSTA